MSANYSFDIPINLGENLSDGLGSTFNAVQGSKDSSPQSTVNASGSPANSTAKPAPQRTHSGSGGGNKKGNSAERRATHNAIERARRESLNGRFLQLAASLPAISDVRRPSKSLIVNKSLDFVSESLSRETLYRLKIDGLRSENAILREQLNEFRRQAGLEVLAPPKFEELPKPLSEMGDKKRSSSLSAVNSSGPSIDFGDLDDDDGLFAPGSDGDPVRTSPTPSGVVADAPHNGANAGIPRFAPAQQASQFRQNQSLMSVPQGMMPNRSSPSASAHSGDRSPAEHGSITNNEGWMSGFDVKNYAPTSGANAHPAQGAAAPFSDFSFTGSSVIMPVSVGQSGMGVNFPQFMASNQPGAANSMQSIDPLAQSHGVGVDLFANLRNAQAQQSQSQPQRQAQQAQQLQLQFAQQQPAQFGHFQQGFDHNANGQHTHHQHSFFENAPLQTAQFMAAV